MEYTYLAKDKENNYKILVENYEPDESCIEGGVSDIIKKLKIKNINLNFRLRENQNIIESLENEITE